MLKNNIVKPYLRKRDINEKGFDFNMDLRQVWHHRFDINKKLKLESIYIEDFAAKGSEIYKLSQVILQFLYFNKIATREQVKTLALSYGFNIEDVKTTIKEFLNSRVLNSFVLADYELEEYPVGGFEFLTLDYGGCTILSQFGAIEDVYWRRSNVLRGADNISRIVTANQVYISLITLLRERLVHFSNNPSFECGRKSIKVSADFSVLDGSGEKKEFLLEVIRASDIAVNMRETAEKIRNFYLNENAISAYFKKTPTLLILVEREEDLREVGSLFARLCEDKVPFRLLSESSIKDGLTEDSFYKYDIESDIIVPVKSNLFMGVSSKG